MNSLFLVQNQATQLRLWLVVCCAQYPYGTYLPYYYNCPYPRTKTGSPYPPALAKKISSKHHPGVPYAHDSQQHRHQ